MFLAPKGPSHDAPTALVTGASSGIGKAIANRLANAGYTVFATSRQPAQPGRDPALHWLPFDSASEHGIVDFINVHGALLSKIELLVNNAGGSSFGDLCALPVEEFGARQRLLYEGPVRLMQAVLPGMRARGRGAVVNITSMAGAFPLPYMAGYSAGKAALSLFTQSLMMTERGSGVVLIDFQAGDFRTAFNANMTRYGEPDARQQRVLGQLEARLQTGPDPEQAATDVLRALRRGRSRMVRSGRPVQRLLAQLGARLLPRSAVLWAIRIYYRLPGR